MTLLGEWNPSTDYEPGDVVYFRVKLPQTRWRRFFRVPVRYEIRRYTCAEKVTKRLYRWDRPL